MSEFIPYLDQLQRRADALGVPLEDACAQEGIADTTLMRWRKGLFSCREQTAQKLFARLDAIAAARDGYYPSEGTDAVISRTPSGEAA